MAQDPYLYPGTQTLINSLNIKNTKQLAELEKKVVSKRYIQPAPKGKFDLDHLKQIHKHLFGDIYPWAGSVRSIDISKGSTLFAMPHRIEPELSKLFKRLNQENLHELNRGDLSHKLSEYFNEINAAHPFREGNGRANRLFITSLAKQYGYNIQWRNMSKQAYIQASIAGTHHVNYKPMERLISQNLVPGTSKITADLEQNHFASKAYDKVSPQATHLEKYKTKFRHKR